MKKVLNILLIFLWIGLYFTIVYYILNLCTYLSDKFIIEKYRVLFKFGTYFLLVYIIHMLIFGVTDKTIRYKMIDCPDLILYIEKHYLKFSITVSISEDILYTTSLLNTSKIEHIKDIKKKINYFYFIYKLKKPIQFIRKQDFIRILSIIKEDELMEKYFLKDLRKEKIKNLFNGF
jgi:energy-coupling factor transporter transmembrane protein EcfT